MMYGEVVNMGDKLSQHMARTIEQRRQALNMTPTELAAAADLSLQQIKNLRRGEIRNYHDVTIMGIARALQWDLDWYQRIQEGETPAPSNGHSPSTSDRSADLSPRIDALLASFDQRNDLVSQLVDEVRRALDEARKRDELVREVVQMAASSTEVLAQVLELLESNRVRLEHIDSYVSRREAGLAPGEGLR